MVAPIMLPPPSTVSTWPSLTTAPDGCAPEEIVVIRNPRAGPLNAPAFR
jgi:hypothetical protein